MKEGSKRKFGSIGEWRVIGGMRDINGFGFKGNFF